MRAVIVLLLAFAALASAQSTVMAPSSTLNSNNAANGETILTPSTNPGLTCAAPPCTQVNTCASPPCPAAAPKPMKPAKVESSQTCGCMQDPICDCRKVQTVEPEIRPQFCGCTGQPNCGCSSNGQIVTAVRDSCGCLHLQVCPCRPKYVAPEVRENHLEPELRENSNNNDICKCLNDPVCACRRVETVTPEIREPRCPCTDTLKLDCACVGLRSN